MKFIMILLVVVAFASAVKKEKVKLSEQRVANMKKVASGCAAEHNVDPGLLSGFVDGSLPRNEANNKYLYCTALKLALIHEDGRANVNKLIEYIDNHPLAGDVAKSFNKCNEVTKENPIATVVELHRCYVETVPLQYSLE